MGHPGEPSVEEILESIKQVIARDNRADAAVRHHQQETRGIIAQSGIGQNDSPRHDAMHDDVFDLAEEAVLGDDEYLVESPLLTESVRSSMRDSLAALAVMAEPGVQPQIVRSGETSLEGMARELLRPALTAWLDKNLPPLVERMVAAEIARIVGKKG